MPAKSSPVKLGGSRKGRRSPSPIVVSSEPDDTLDNESEAQSGIATPDDETLLPSSISGVVTSPDVDIDELLEATKYVGRKRAAPKIDSDSDIEIVSHTTGKKAKTGTGSGQESSSLLAALDEPLHEKRLRRPTEKARAANSTSNSPSKRSVATVKKSTQQVVSEDDTVVKTPTVRRIKPASKAKASEPIKEPPAEELERGLLAKCVLVPFSSNTKASEDETMMDLKTLLSSLSTKDDLRLVAAALKFTSYTPFINPSSASPDLVAVEKDHLVWADSRLKAVFFTTGCVSACNLITPSPGINNSAAAKKLLLFPIEGVFQEALDFFGYKFKVSHAAGQISNGVVTYSTKKEGHVVYSTSSGKFLHRGMGSPKKKGLFKKPSSQPSVLPGGNFPVALSFGDEVPIYDATDAGFEFKGSDLANIRSLPLFRKGTHDLPPYAVVTVGYTVTSFVTANSASANTAFLFNILFVILLAEKIADDED